MKLPTRYTKVKPFSYLTLKESWIRLEALKDKYRITFGILGLLLIFFGSFILFSQFLFPRLSLLSKMAFVKPVSGEYFSELSSKKEFFVFQELIKRQKEINETQRGAKEEVPETFNLSVPKLGITKALVETNSVDASPDERLGHFKGSCLPSETCNVFIYGHSTLKVLYKPNDYKTIFSTLDELESGDKVIIEYLDRRYNYVIERQEVLGPSEVDPLEIKELRGDSLTLMTCFPPGATTQRLLVHAKKTY